MGNDSRKPPVGELREYKPGKWVARISRGYRVDGKRRRISQTFDSMSEAEAWLLAMSVELDSTPDLSRGITLDMLWKAYEKSRGVSLAKSTMSVYRHYMETVWVPLFGLLDVTSIAPHAVQAQLDQMTRENAKHGKTALSSVLSWACKAGILEKSPLQGHRFEFPDQDTVLDDWDDPFAAIEGARDVWSYATCMRCFALIRGLPLEPAWLLCVGAGLRVEESLAIRRADVRRVDIGGRMVTQVAVHAARTAMERRKATKTGAKSVRIVGVMEPFGERYWAIASAVADRKELICDVSASNQNKRWTNYFDTPSTSKHAPRKAGCNYRGVLHELPYLPLSKMRNTHVTLMTEAGVPDSINALMHGHTEVVERRHYLSPDITKAAIDASDKLRLVV